MLIFSNFNTTPLLLYTFLLSLHEMCTQNLKKEKKKKKIEKI